MDYLLEEVLQRQPPEVQAFLLKTSVLERLNGPLCQAVAGETGSQAILAGLEQANLFVTALDNKRYWYRYHPLFADLLRHRLRQSFALPDWMELYTRACAWYEHEGLISEAVSQALAAPAYDLAADLLEHHILEVFYRGETMLVHHWLQALPEDILRKRAILCAMYANTNGHMGLYQPQALGLSETWLQAAEQALAESAPAHEQPVPSAADITRSFIALSRAYLALWKGEAPQTVIELARKALAGLPPENEKNIDLNFQRFRSGLMNNLAISYMNIGDEEAAILAYAEAQRIGAACGDLLNMYSAIANQTFILRRHGRIREAADLCRQALSSQLAKEDKAEKSLPYIGVVYASLGLILLEWNDLEAAGPALSRSLELSRLLAAADGQLDSFIGLARLKQAQGDFTGAMDLLDQVELDTDKATILVPAMRVRLYLAQSYEQPQFLKKALAWAEGKTLLSPGSWWQATEVSYPGTGADSPTLECSPVAGHPHAGAGHPHELPGRSARGS